MSAPWMPLYVADYIADTGHLTTLEHGAYLLLIMTYWRKGGLPDDDAQLARITRLSLDEWLNVRSTVAELFHDGWKHKRIDAELSKAADKAKQASEAGKRSAEARSAQRTLNRRSTPVPTNGEPSQPQPLSESNPPPSLPTTPTAKVGGGGIFDEFWGKFPKSPASSPSKARAAFNELTADEQRQAIDYLPAFKSVKTTNPMSPERYIRDRIFDNLTPRVVSTTEKVKHDSPEGKAWDAYERQIKGKPPPWTNGVWYFPTKTPPASSDIVCMRS